MAERRMFAKTIVDSDAFLDMPVSTQNLYFHLAMRADDDGFINSPKKIARVVNASDDDLKVLIAKNFIIPFETGVVVIKHWRLHNYLRNDRYKPTVYQDEKSQLNVKDNGVYTFGIPDGNQVATQVRLGKDSIGKNREEPPIFDLIDKLDGSVLDNINKCISKLPKQSYEGFNHVTLTEEEYQGLIRDYGQSNTTKILDCLDAHKESVGKTYKSDRAAIRKWVIGALKLQKRQSASGCPKCGLAPFVVVCKCGYAQGDEL